MSRANERQVGGDHYAASIQHWDVVEDHEVGYLECVATKYVTRHRKSGTRQEDLEKAEHYVEKLIERHLEKGRQCRGRVPEEVTRMFAVANDLTPTATQVVGLLFDWGHHADLDRARRLIQRLQWDADA